VSQTLEAVDFVDSELGWAVGDQGTVIHTTDGGATWQSQDPGTGNAEILLHDIDFVDSNQGWSAGGVFQPEEGVMVHTETGGE
jgi:photosystem II stability/assembly factor-like uncharacterized protein